MRASESTVSRVDRHEPLLLFVVLGTALSLCVSAALNPSPARGEASAGYSEYIVPFDEDVLVYVSDPVVAGNISDPNNSVYSVISITGWADGVQVYYDHWEDGYDLDPNSPTTADERYSLNTGQVLNFISPAVPRYRTQADGNTYRGDGDAEADGDADCRNQAAPATPIARSTFHYCYDGRDRVITAGGATTMSRAGWPINPGVVAAAAEEVYPIEPQLIKYILPFGETNTRADYNRVFAVIQAVQDNTVLQIDFNGDGTYDAFNHENGYRTPRANPVEGTQLTLQRGQSYILDRDSENADGGTTPLLQGVVILGSKTLQVQYFFGQTESNMNTRSVAAYPRGFWDDEYYAPVSSRAADSTEILLHNPNSSTITINWQTRSNSGSFTLSPYETGFFQAKTGLGTGAIPFGSAVYLSGSDVFWGTSDVDTNSTTFDWSYSLVPAYLLRDEQFVAWAPGSEPGHPTLDRDANGIFVTPVQDNTTFFVDRNGDGQPDTSVLVRRGTTTISPTGSGYLASRLDSLYITAADGDDGVGLSGAHIWATGPFAMAYGENPSYAPDAAPGIDLGYTSLPAPEDWMDLALTVDKATDPVLLATSANPAVATYTLAVASHEFTIDGVRVLDLLPYDWTYSVGTDTTSITLPNGSTIYSDPTVTAPGAALPADFGGTCPSGGGSCLTWGSAVLGNMSPQQTITIVFTARTIGTPDYTSGQMSRNSVRATATRTVGGVTQTFTTSDFVFNAYLDTSVSMQITKDSSVAEPVPVSPGDTLTYTVSVTNPAGSTTSLTNVALSDPLPSGVSYVAGSGSVTCELPHNVRDEFASASYSNNGPNNTDNWATSWTETDAYGTGPGGSGAGPAGGFVWITGGVLQFRYLVSTVADAFSSQSYSLNTGSDNWSGNWTEGPGLDGSPSIVANEQIYISGGRLSLDRSSSGTDFYIYRDATIPGSGARAVTIRFTPFDAGIDAGEAVVAEYSVDGGAYTTLGTFDGGGGGWSGNQQTYTRTITGSVLRLRFRATGNWNENNDEFEVDNVEITYDIPAAGSQIQRTANLTGALDPSLTFSASSANLEAGDTLAVEAASSPSGPFTTLATYTGGTPSVAQPYDLTPYVSATTTIRFRITGGYNATDEYFNFDNVNIGFYRLDNFTSGSPPNLLAGATPCRIRPDNALTLTFNVTVDNPLPTGLTEIVNTATATATQIPVPLSDDARNIVNNPSALSAQVSGTIWLDGDGDGIRDVGEPGLANVEVTLKDQWGTPIAVTTTDLQGHYSFLDVAPGSGYYVEVTGGLPSGLSQTAPGGHSDNRSNAFDLTAGEHEQNVDLGYRNAPGTAAFGDLVWSDADGDGFRDPGEPGIPGVTVSLIWDIDENGAYDPLEDLLISEVVTGPAGDYLFTGITANGSRDYLVIVDPTQSALSGYTATTPNAFRFVDAAPDTSYFTADAGFRNISTYSISDRVWYDADGDGEADPGETGISGVTVDLLDNSGNVIATASTDTNGNITFSGLPNGTYRLRVTDNANKLADYYGTTTYAQSGLRTGIVVSGANVSNTSFGYGISRAIGDTVFNDVDGDGTQDPGEAGIGAVTVLLYRDVDNDGNFEPGGDDGGPVGSVVTDANGNYLFSGLSNARYWVSIDNTQAALSNYSILTTGDDVGGAAGHQRVVVLSGSSNLDIDYGYRSPSPRTLSGRLWNDQDNDGIDDGEPGLGNVTIELYNDLDGDGVIDPGEPRIAVTTTASDGTYSFTGVPGSGTQDYIVRITDEYGVLSGYNTTYEKTEGASGPFNGRESILNLNGNVTDLNFGYNKPQPTYAIISAFHAYTLGGQVVVEWQTALEAGTVGFFLARFDPASGRFVRVNETMLPGLIDAPQGGAYRYVDHSAVPGGKLTYELVEVEARGGTRRHGPYTVSVGNAQGSFLRRSDSAADSELLSSGYSRTARRPSPAAVAQLKAREAAREAARAARSTLGRLRDVKIGVGEAGLYRLDLSDVAAALNVPVERVERWVRAGVFRLTSAGEKAAYLASDDGAGVYFFAEAVDSPYTNENVYWVRKGRSPKMAVVGGEAPPAASAAATFVDTIHLEEDRSPATSVFDDPEADFWMWDYIFAGHPTLGQKSFNFQVPDPGLVGTAILTVHLKGGADTGATPDHHVRISVNGNFLGEDRWNGIDDHWVTATVDQLLLNSGNNTLTVTGVLDAGVPYSLFYLDSFDLTYERHYRAVDDRLLCRAGADGVITVDGFTEPDILVLNVAVPKQPVVVAATNIEPSGGGYRVSFAAGEPGTPYLVTRLGAARTPRWVEGDLQSHLKRGNKRVDYLVIAPSDLRAGAQALADYRAAQGLATMVVDVEDIMDEFAGGLTTPRAIRDFLAHAYATWSRAPRYVLLVGDGSFDYKNVMGRGENLVPPLLAATADGLFASDNKLADVVGNDGVPEMAVGRLPVLTATELDAVIDKIVAYEANGAAEWSRRVLMMADNADAAGDFPADSDRMAALIPPEYGVERVQLPTYTPAAARTRILAAINEGLGLADYIGHGSIQFLADEQILRASDVPGLTNGERTPLMLFMTCTAGRFELPGFPSLSETLLLHQGGGAVAVWAPTGLSVNADAVRLNEAFFSAYFSGSGARLGDVVLQSLATGGSTVTWRYVLDIYDIFGDPALLLSR